MYTRIVCRWFSDASAITAPALSDAMSCVIGTRARLGSANMLPFECNLLPFFVAPT